MTTTDARLDALEEALRLMVDYTVASGEVAERILAPVFAARVEGSIIDVWCRRCESFHPPAMHSETAQTPPLASPSAPEGEPLPEAVENAAIGLEQAADLVEAWAGREDVPEQWRALADELRAHARAQAAREAEWRAKVYAVEWEMRNLAHTPDSTTLPWGQVLDWIARLEAAAKDDA